MTGDPERERRALELFDEASSMAGAAREEWLRQQTIDDPELAQEVAALLAAHDAEGVLDRPLSNGPPVPAVGETGATLVARVAEALRDRYDGFEPLGEGGMAIVYLARERKHDRKVVLKVLRPEVAAIYGEDRFLREMRLTSNLSHPHILPFIDSGRADGLLYYVMPYTAGDTLQELIRRAGALSPQRAGPLLRDVADALAYAHSQGVVHRDLKPANVLCVDDHAYLMDFGVAKALQADPADGLTRPGFSPGTPQYMAPEQLTGDLAVGAPADVFAWGQLAHETLTGTLIPARGASPETVELRLGQQTQRFPDAWNRVIARTLSNDPERRPSARELYDVLRAESMSVTREGEPTRSTWKRRTGVAAALLGVLAVGLWSRDTSEPAPLPVPEVTPIAVAPFRNETGDASLDFLGRLAGDWITQGVRDLGNVVVPWSVTRDILERVLSDTATDPVLVLQNEVGARTVVTGRFYRVGDQVSFAADVTDAEGSTLLVAMNPVSAPLDQAEVALEELRDRIMGSISAMTGERTAGLQSLVNRAPTLEAYRSFDRGLELYLAQDYDRGKEEFIAAFDRDTTFLPSLIYGTLAATNAGDRPTRDSLMAFLGLRRDRLSRYDNLRWQFLNDMDRGESQSAIRALRQANALAPGTSVAYNLALVANGLNRPLEALAALNTLDPDRGETRGWAQYWTQRIHALHLLGRHEEEAADAAEMLRRHPERTVAPVFLARALAASGQLEDLEEAVAASAPRPPRTYWSHGGTLTVAGEALLAHGSPSDAEHYFAQAEQWLDAQIEAEPDYTNHWYWKAALLYDQRRWQEADEAAEALYAAEPDDHTFLGMTAVSAARVGDAARARERLADPHWDERPGEQRLYAARVHAILGDLDRALAELAAALEGGIGGFGWAHATAHHEFSIMLEDERFVRLLDPNSEA